eukprot:TRINITY_DN4843_c0_g1_i2.p1 TRINITY_DN4843_c0_g1~~TRINITY_DN4843_c0_g1_i2.p1  ORF type:complete len:390 (+),score=71.22 TRINITY_DN4843_c0_g1_i2:224-1393(+)
MCGRAACTLAPQDLKRKFAYTRRAADCPSDKQPPSPPAQQPQNEDSQQCKDEDDMRKEDSSCDYIEPAFIDEAAKYKQSYNTTPKQHLPVLLQSKDGHREFRVMQWGLVPSWHKGDPSNFTLSMFNARLEGIADKASFRTPLKWGRRCVVVVDGFYEWQVLSNKKRQPYFIYFSNSGNASRCQSASQAEAVKGSIRPLTLAGIYDVWKPKASPATSPKKAAASSTLVTESPSAAETEDSNVQSALETFTIITVPAAASLGWLHDRMPAVLTTDEDVDAWLDAGKVPAHEALSRLSPVNNALAWHPVGRQVGNIRYSEPDCVVEVDPVPQEEKQRAKMASGMAAWLNKASPKRSTKTAASSRDEAPVAKLPKCKSTEKASDDEVIIIDEE